jgi:hypothetical protein
MAEDAVLAAGTRVYFKISGESGDYLELEGVRNLGRIGVTGSYVEQTTIKDRARRYVSGLADTEESTIRIADYSADANQAKFIEAAQNRRNADLKIVWPANAAGKSLVGQIDVALSGYGVPETSDGNAIVEFEVNYRMSGEPVFIRADQGKVFSISALTVTSGGTFAAADGEYQLTQGVDFLTSGSGVGAVVTVTIASNTITAVRIDHGGLGFAQNDTLTVSKVGGVNGTADATLTVTTVS